MLSVRQPWAWAIIHGGKDVENRNWPTKFRGRLAIHAGNQFDLTKREFIAMWQGDCGPVWQDAMVKWVHARDSDVPACEFGAIIGTVEVVDCIPNRLCDSPWKADGDDFYCWLLANPVALQEPIPMKGRLGLWDVPDDLFPPRFVARPEGF